MTNDLQTLKITAIKAVVLQQPQPIEGKIIIQLSPGEVWENKILHVEIERFLPQLIRFRDAGLITFQIIGDGTDPFPWPEVGDIGDILTAVSDGSGGAEPVWGSIAGGDTFALSTGRNAIVTNVFLRGGGNVPTNVAGFTLPFDTTLVGMGAATAGPFSWIAEVRNNGVAIPVAQLPVVAAAQAYTAVLSVTLNAGDELSVYCNGTTINRPAVTLFLRRR